MRLPDRLLGIGIPAIVFVGVGTSHYLWHGIFLEQDRLQSQWVELTVASAPWGNRYIVTQDYWLGFSYALSLAFAVHAFQRYRRNRFCAGEKLALGSVTFTGFLAVAGCFLIGCCGSPMAAVYLSLFGAAFLPFAKPIIGIFTTVTVAAAWLHLHSHRHTVARATMTGCPTCGLIDERPTIE